MRKNIFDKLHNLSHPGIKTSRKLISSRYFWPGMNNDVGNWTKNCQACQIAKISRHTKTPYGEFKIPSCRFEHIHMDLVGPLPPSNNFQYILTIIDRFTRWPEAIPIVDMKTTTVMKAFIENYIARYGVPLEITTDQGGQFESNLADELNKLLGSHRTRTTSYHPQANGLVERLHRTLKTALYARQNTENWSIELPLILLGIRTSIKTDLGCTPADLVYGQSLKIPGDFIDTTKQNNVVLPQSDFVMKLRTAMQNLIAKETRQTKQKDLFISQDLTTCEYVFVRIDKVKTGLTPPYAGPYKVLKRMRKFFVLEINGKNTSVSLDRLKPAYMTENVENKSIKKVSFCQNNPLFYN